MGGHHCHAEIRARAQANPHPSRNPDRALDGSQEPGPRQDLSSLNSQTDRQTEESFRASAPRSRSFHGSCSCSPLNLFRNVFTQSPHPAFTFSWFHLEHLAPSLEGRESERTTREGVRHGLVYMKELQEEESGCKRSRCSVFMWIQKLCKTTCHT